jgi:hypothetical protein
MNRLRSTVALAVVVLVATLGTGFMSGQPSPGTGTGQRAQKKTCWAYDLDSSGNPVPGSQPHEVSCDSKIDRYLAVDTVGGSGGYVAMRSDQFRAAFRLTRVEKGFKVMLGVAEVQGPRPTTGIKP